MGRTSRRDPHAAPRTCRVQLLALEDCTPIVPVSVFDLLRKSVELAATIPTSEARPEIIPALIAGGASPLVRAAGGIELRCAGTVADCEPGDLIVAPALDPDVLPRLDANRGAVEFLRRAYARGASVASVCTGAFLLAEAGLLDGRRAATHWAFQDLFAARYPRVELAPQAVVVDAGRVVTTGGATSFLSLTLLLVERLLGPDVSRAASKMFLIDVNKAPQGAYAMFASQKSHADEAILRAQAMIEDDPAGSASVDDLARATAMSPRSFNRRFREATGNAPWEYIQRVRVEAARRALERSHDPVGVIAERVGYRDAVAFRKVFVRLTGLTPADYRARYGPRAAPVWISAAE